ncbi:MAG: DinB family protein [Fimbriimonadaceae bacterium]|nr:DinB family protein [Fimbriimonadaceae bacterium]
MSDFAASWSLSRKRLLDEVSPLSQAQLNWRMHPGSLTIGEMAMHVAGVEVSFMSQLQGLALDEHGRRLALAATEGVVNDNPFPYAESEITPVAIAQAFDFSHGLVEPVITAPSEELRQKEIKSALGPMISGEGALARLGFHSAYHQGQAYLMKTAPGFPNE